jgi:hypothetical protein
VGLSRQSGAVAPGYLLTRPAMVTATARCGRGLGSREPTNGRPRGRPIRFRRRLCRRAAGAGSSELGLVRATNSICSPPPCGEGSAPSLRHRRASNPPEYAFSPRRAQAVHVSRASRCRPGPRSRPQRRGRPRCREATPSARLRPIWPPTDTGCRLRVRFHSLTRTLAPTPAPMLASPLAPT